MHGGQVDGPHVRSVFEEAFTAAQETAVLTQAAVSAARAVRNATIVALRNAGFSWTELGDVCGITKQAVSQIVDRADRWGPAPAGPVTLALLGYQHRELVRAEEAASAALVERALAAGRWMLVEQVPLRVVAAAVAGATETVTSWRTMASIATLADVRPPRAPHRAVWDPPGDDVAVLGLARTVQALVAPGGLVTVVPHDTTGALRLAVWSWTGHDGETTFQLAEDLLGPRAA